MSSTAWLLLVLHAAAGESSIDFDSHVVPVLTRSGCNAGACHGAAAGRGGFALSLLGADPEKDYETIVQSLEGRRINRHRPEQSLLVRKPTGQLDHGGGEVLEPDGEGARRLLTWIRSGAVRTSPRRLQELNVTPRQITLPSLPGEVQLHVTASFSDGAVEEVTPWTTFTSADPAATEIDERHRVHVKRRGQHVLVARFMDRVIPLQFQIPLNDQPVDLTNEPRANFIDTEVYRRLSEMRLPVSPPATDAVWLRRVSLDLIGRLPQPVEVDTFVADDDQEKRDGKVTELLSRSEFADYWTLRFARMLRLHSLPHEPEVAQVYAGWLRREIAHDTPLDQLVRQMLTATGDSHAIGPANFSRMVGDARQHAELVGQAFLGARLGCANCHNHPLDRWTQDDYHGLAAIFARLDRGRNVTIAARGAVTNLRTNEPAIPRIPGERYLTPDGDHRELLAEWLVSGKDRHFAKAMVNRVWQAMFGRGLVEPVDDLRETNPATHPELLDTLAEDFVAHGYRLRHLLRRIALSHTYGRSHETNSGNEHDDRFDSHAYARPLWPEVLADALADVTGVTDDFAGQPRGTRAIALVDPLQPAPSLDFLGRCTRVDNCQGQELGHGGLTTQLHLMNGPVINRKLSDPDGHVQRLLKSGATSDTIVGEFYLRALGRRPTERELETWRTRLADGEADEFSRRVEDFVWSLLNSRAFVENR